MLLNLYETKIKSISPRNINHPINGKLATTRWRPLPRYSLLLSSWRDKDYDKDDDKAPPSVSVSLLELRPLTGSYHQIRRHLSYCLGRQVAGDTKYNGGGEAARRLRPGGGCYSAPLRSSL